MVEQTGSLGVGFFYVFLALANLILATRLRPIPKPILPKDEELEEEDKKLLKAGIPEVIEDGGFNYNDVMRGFRSTEEIVENFNDSINKNRWVLCLAAASLFFAAGISFWQAFN